MRRRPWTVFSATCDELADLSPPTAQFSFGLDILGGLGDLVSGVVGSYR